MKKDLKQSLERVAAGGIPLRAEERLQEEIGAHARLFTSDLSVPEFLLARDAECAPIAQVMGSSVFHVGEIGDYRGTTGEVTVISDGHRRSRRAALARLQLEAQLVGADAVIGVLINDRAITMGKQGKSGDDGGEVLEFTVVGTAVKAPWITHPPDKPILTDLSGQELWALHQDGFEPCGFVFDFCRYHVWHVLNPLGLDAEFQARLAREGGASGDIRISLLWNNLNDLDLHVRTPGGEEISYSNKRGKCGGRLDIDMNYRGRNSRQPIENVFWAHGGAPSGKYQVSVRQINTTDAHDTDFRVEVVTGSQVAHHKGRLSGPSSTTVCSFQYDNAPFEIAQATGAVDTARAIVTQRLQEQAREIEAEFVIGSDLDVEVRESPCGFLGCELNDLDVIVSWFGTGVRRIPGAQDRPRQLPSYVLPMIPLGRRNDAVLDLEEDDIEAAAEEAQEAAEALDEANAPPEVEDDDEGGGGSE